MEGGGYEVRSLEMKGMPSNEGKNRFFGETGGVGLVL